MIEQVRVTSPEGVTFSLEVAGLGSRFLAVLLDMLIQGSLLLVLFLALGLVEQAYEAVVAVSLGGRPEAPNFWLLAAAILIAFAIVWGYFVFFEMVWNGQSPGKRAMGLRVLKEGGYPVDLFASAVRNLVRLVDFLPWGYGVGVVVMFFNREWKRLGDLAAGTIVVKERRRAAPEELRPAAAPDRGAGWTAARLSRDEYDLVRQFLSRRGELALGPRTELAHRIANPLAARLGVELGLGAPVRERFLEQLAEEYLAAERPAGPADTPTT